MTLTQVQKRLLRLRLGTMMRPEKLTLLAMMELSIALTKWLPQLDQQIYTLLGRYKLEEVFQNGNNCNRDNKPQPRATAAVAGSPHEERRAENHLA
jgi:hypothetical protein